jgi:hypothetical protein
VDIYIGHYVCMNTANSETGSKYEATKGLDISAVAKLVRADIKAAIVAGEIPAGTVCSVRCERYSGGQSLSIYVTGFVGSARIDDEAMVDVARSNGVPMPWLTRVAYNTIGALESIRAAYNYDRSDIQSDYFNVRFYGSVSFAEVA